jgi:hypothetical protein
LYILIFKFLDSRLTSLIAPNTVYVFFFMVSMLSPNIHIISADTAADMSHFISVHLVFLNLPNGIF